MFKYLNKGIAASLAITIIVLIAFSVGGIIVWQYKEMTKETETAETKIAEDKTQPEKELPEEKVEEPEISLEFLKSCSVNSDCIKVLANPCTSALEICRTIAINKKYKNYWDNILSECESKGVKCEDTAPGDESFRLDPECIQGKCELTKQRPYTVTPQCGVVTTDHLIPFGWFPVDYESKHIIQIDNNPDFSSPEIEEYETNSGTFIPKIPLDDGTYSWRVKSTKLEREKCIAPPCAPSADDPNDPCNLAIKSYLECKKQYSKWSDVCNITIITID